MSDIDWGNIKNEMGGNSNYKVYAPVGKYKAKCIGVEFKEVGTNGSIIQKFEFEDGEYKYPTADHWLSFKNDHWRLWHNKCLMVVLGASEENAKKAVEVCESKNKKEDIVKSYEQAYSKLLSKKPEVEIEVYSDGKYSKTEFMDGRVAMPHENVEQKDDDVAPTDIPDDDEITMDDIPFN